MNVFKQWYIKRTRFNLPYFSALYKRIAEIRKDEDSYEAYDKNGDWLGLVWINGGKGDYA